MRRAESQIAVTSEEDLVLADQHVDRLADGDPGQLLERPGRHDRLGSDVDARRAASASPRAGSCRSRPSSPRRSANSTSTPVSTGRDSSRDAARDTWATVVDEGLAIDRKRRPRRRRAGAGSPRRPGCAACTRSGRRRSAPCPDPAGCSIVTARRGSARTMSSSSRPGSTIEPGSSTRGLQTGTRSDSSMSVAASSRRPSASARTRIPDRIWTVDRCETPRAAIWSCASRLSWGHTIFMWRCSSGVTAFTR